MKQNQNKILVVASSGLGKTGVPNVIYQVVRALSENYSIDVVVFNDEDYYAPKIKELGARIIRVDDKYPRKRVPRTIWRLFKEKRITKFIFSELFKNNTYQAIHSFKEHDSAFIFQTASTFKINKRIIHCNNEIHKPKNIISRYLFNKKMKLIKKYTTCYIGVSNECCSKSYPGVEYKVLFNAYDESKYNTGVHSKLKPFELVLTQLATFSSRKNQLFSIDVFESLLKKYPFAKLNLVGVEAEFGYLEKIKEKITKLNIKDSVNIVDGSKDISDIFRYSTFFLLPSLHEAAPISLVETQACGIFSFVSNTVTKDVDCGGLCYLDISEPLVWADKIDSYFVKYNNVRKTYDVSRFSIKKFNEELLSIYSII